LNLFFSAKHDNANNVFLDELIQYMASLDAGFSYDG